MASVDDLFLPVLFAVFTSSLLTVLQTCYSLKLREKSLIWRTTMLSLLTLAVTAILLQAPSTWKKDFLHQVGLVSTPVLWRRVVSRFILAHKLTIDTTENYWITSQLISFVLPFVAFINMQRRHMDIPWCIVCAYLSLGLTGSYGGMFALFLYHFYNSSSFSKQQLTFGEQFTQVISSVGGCGAIVFLKDATLSQFKLALFPILFIIFVLPFLSPGTRSVQTSSGSLKEYSFGLYFFIFLSIFLTVYHYYLTYFVFTQWISLKAFALVAFGHAYQYAATVDVISCMVILPGFVTLEFLSAMLSQNCRCCFAFFKVLLVFLIATIFTIILSPGGLLAFFLAYREHFKTVSH